MTKEKKTYRLDQEAIENLQYVKDMYKVINGVKMSDAQIIEMALYDYSMNLAMKLNMEHEKDHESYREQILKELEDQDDV